MAIEYIKKAQPVAESNETNVTQIVEKLLNEINIGGEDAVRKLSKELDKWDGEIVVSKEAIKKAKEQVPEQLKKDIAFAHNNIRRFAESQKKTITDCSLEIVPGFWAGQKQIPIHTAGCYVPGGRYAHIASAIMTVTTAKVAGVKNIIAVSPPKPGVGIHPAILFTLDFCGANTILNLGGVQGVATMAQGLFGTKKADILVGPGNQFVAEAKRILFGKVGIDMFAGPTNNLIIADEGADPYIIAWDLIGQAEHGHNSPVWLVTNSKKLADQVSNHVDEMIASLPETNSLNARAAWDNYAEIVLCDTREEMVSVSDQYAPEHLQVQAKDLDWWLDNLSSYGSLFLGEETTVAYGDKASGTNHVLPTSGAARYTGGLSVHKFMKTVTWQRGTREGTKSIAEATSRISRAEGMEGHAITADIRLKKYSQG